MAQKPVLGGGGLHLHSGDIGRNCPFHFFNFCMNETRALSKRVILFYFFFSNCTLPWISQLSRVTLRRQVDGGFIGRRDITKIPFIILTFLSFFKQVEVHWTVPEISPQMHLLTFPLFLPVGMFALF